MIFIFYARITLTYKENNMIVKRQKTFATASKILTDDAIRKGVAKEVKISTEWIKKHPFDPGLLHKKSVKRVSLFSK